MHTYLSQTLRLSLAPILLVGGLTVVSRAEEPSTSVTSAAALHSPQHCDLSLSLAEMVKIRPPKAAKRYKISYAMISLAGYFYQGTAYGAVKAAEEAGVDLNLNASQGFATQAQQVSNVNNELSRGIDGLLINPVDVNGAVGAVEDAVAKGVAVVSIGTLVNTAKADRTVQDDYTQGIAAAEFIASKLPNGGEGIVMGGPANATWALRRVAGFVDGLKKFPQVKISAITHQNVDPAEGLARFTNATQAHPKVDWIYATYNLQLPPNSVPTKYANALYVAGGLDPLMVDALKAGTAAAALPDYAITEGYVGLSNLVRKLNGEKLPSITCLPNGVVTKDELSSSDMTSQNLFPTGWKATAH
jgi:ribose transport system substrate-binding protein